jgi:hypothetical protein
VELRAFATAKTLILDEFKAMFAEANKKTADPDAHDDCKRILSAVD